MSGFCIDLQGVGEVEISEGNFTFFEIGEAGKAETHTVGYYEWKDSPDFSAKAAAIEIMVRSLLEDFKEYDQLPPLVRQQAA